MNIDNAYRFLDSIAPYLLLAVYFIVVCMLTLFIGFVVVGVGALMYNGIKFLIGGLK